MEGSSPTRAEGRGGFTSYQDLDGTIAQPTGSCGAALMPPLSLPRADGLYQIQGVFPVWGLVTLVGSVLAIIIFITTSNEEPPKYHCVRCPLALNTHRGPPQPAPDWAEGPGSRAAPPSSVSSAPRRDTAGWRCPGPCTMRPGTGLPLCLAGICLPRLFGQCHVDQRGGHRAGEHPPDPGYHLPAEQHRAGLDAAGLGQQHRW